MITSIRNNITARISPTRTHWSGLRSEFKARLLHFRRGRDADQQKALEQDFALVLEAWGIASETDIPFILLDLRLRCLFLAVPVAVALLSACFTPGMISCLTLILIAPPCLFGLLTTRWRMSVLQTRAFKPLHRWLLARFIQPRSK